MTSDETSKNRLFQLRVFPISQQNSVDRAIKISSLSKYESRLKLTGKSIWYERRSSSRILFNQNFVRKRYYEKGFT